MTNDERSAALGSSDRTARLQEVLAYVRRYVTSEDRRRRIQTIVDLARVQHDLDKERADRGDETEQLRMPSTAGGGRDGTSVLVDETGWTTAWDNTESECQATLAGSSHATDGRRHRSRT